MSSRDDEKYDPVVELVKINPVPSLIMDMGSLAIVVVNEATTKLIGYSEKDLLGKSILEFVPADDIAAVRRSLEEPPPEGETQWRAVVGGKTLYIKLKYRDTKFQGRPARFMVASQVSATPFSP